MLVSCLFVCFSEKDGSVILISLPDTLYIAKKRNKAFEETRLEQDLGKYWK